MRGALVVGIVAVLSAPASAQPFVVVSDGDAGIWVLDGRSGEVSWCRLVTPAGAKLVDVFGADAQVRDAPPRPPQPECDVVRRGSGEGADFDVAAFLDDPEAYGWTGGDLRSWQTRGDVGGGSHRGDVDAARER